MNVHHGAHPGLALLPWALASSLHGCAPPVTCGEGTHLTASNACAPDNTQQPCGAGTRYDGMQCIVTGNPLVCGAGTVMRDGACVADTTTLTCGRGTIAQGAACVSAALQHLPLPFPAGMRVLVGQGNHGAFSHQGRSAYAIDFSVAEGTTVVAARGGRVQAVREDSNTGCATIACAEQANYVLIDHGDGTFGMYFHLQLDGALVEPGAMVCAGQPIGRSGNTGFSSEPHLHFQINNFFGHSLPIYFDEIGDMSDGTAYAGGRFTSMNAAPAACSEMVEFSRCGARTFEHQGVLLDQPVACSRAVYDMDYPVTGRVLVSGARVQIAMFSTANMDWMYACATPAADGRFTATIRYPEATFGAQTYLMISAADTSCRSFNGWESSIPVFLSRP